MTAKSRLAAVVGLLVMLKEPPEREERGLSQSVETALLIAAAVAVIAIIAVAVTAFVRSKMGELR